MDALDVFRAGAEVGCVVDFVFEELVVGLVREVRYRVWEREKRGGGRGRRGVNVRCR